MTEEEAQPDDEKKARASALTLKAAPTRATDGIQDQTDPQASPLPSGERARVRGKETKS